MNKSADKALASGKQQPILILDAIAMIRPSILFFVVAGVALAQALSQDDVSRQLSELSALVQKLQARVDELESRVLCEP